MCPAVVSGIVTGGGGGGGRAAGQLLANFLFFLVPSNIPRSRYVS